MIGIAMLLFLASTTASAEVRHTMDKGAMKALVEMRARENKLDPALLSAIIKVESNWNPWAMHYEPNYRHVRNIANYAAMSHVTMETERQLQRTALGLMQIVGGTARACGFRGPLSELLDPRKNTHLGARLLRRIKARYPARDDQIAAWNAGSVFRNRHTGRYVNEGYVRKVLRALHDGERGK